MEQDILHRIWQAKSGDKEALIQLIMSQKEDYYRLAYVYMKDQEDALDAMSDMIVKVFENIKSLKTEEAFFSWSKTILVNCCKQHLRKKHRVILLQELPEESYEESYSEHEEQLAFEAHLEKLNVKYQEVLRLRFALDMDYATIAKVIKIPIGTVKSRIYAGLQKLQKSMEVDGNGL
ncbi:MAG: sigma-70 family RNA polymerase sigma factor [Syntrophomonadaceae bacterium]|nr:sigma-70 family RNA polymerase sigma factor [Syntrophomonadaceae bacterium]